MRPGANTSTDEIRAAGGARLRRLRTLVAVHLRHLRQQWFLSGVALVFVALQASTAGTSGGIDPDVISGPGVGMAVRLAWLLSFAVGIVVAAHARGSPTLAVVAAGAAGVHDRARAALVASLVGATLVTAVAVATLPLHVRHGMIAEPAVLGAVARLWLSDLFLAAFGLALRAWMPVLPAFAFVIATQGALPMLLDDPPWVWLEPLSPTLRLLVGQAGFLMPPGVFNRISLQPWFETALVTAYAVACTALCAAAVSARLERDRRRGSR